MTPMGRLTLAASVAPGICPLVMGGLVAAGWVPSPGNLPLRAFAITGMLMYLLATPAFVVIQLVLHSPRRWLTLPAAGAAIPFPMVFLVWVAFDGFSEGQEGAVHSALLYVAPIMGAVGGALFTALAGRPVQGSGQ